MSARTKTYLRIGVSLAILVILFSRLDWRQAEDLVRGANPVLLAIPVLVSVVDRVWMAWKWRMLLAVLSPVPSLPDAVRVYYVSSFQGLVLPLGGLGADILRYAHLRSSGIEPHAVTLSIVFERAIGMVATMLVGMTGIVVLASKLGPGSATRTALVWIFATALAASLAGLLLFFHAPTQRLFYRVAGLGRIKQRFGGRLFVQRALEAVESYRRAPREIGRNLFLSILEQLFPVVSLFFGALAFGIPLTVTDCLAVAPVTLLVQRIPVGYAGIGIREGTMVFILGLLGIGYADTLVLTTALFFAFLLSMLPGAVWSFSAARVPTT